MPNNSSSGTPSRGQAAIEGEFLSEICAPVPDARIGALSEECGRAKESRGAGTRGFARYRASPLAKRRTAKPSNGNGPLPVPKSAQGVSGRRHLRFRSLVNRLMTRQDNNSVQKASNSRRSRLLQKKCLSLQESKHSAVQCWPRVVRMPWYISTLASTWAPAVGRSPASAGCLAARKKKQGRSSGKKHAGRILNVVCTFKLFAPCSKSYASLRSVSLVSL